MFQLCNTSPTFKPLIHGVHNKWAVKSKHVDKTYPQRHAWEERTLCTLVYQETDTEQSQCFTTIEQKSNKVKVSSSCMDRKSLCESHTMRFLLSHFHTYTNTHTHTHALGVCLVAQVRGFMAVCRASFIVFGEWEGELRESMLSSARHRFTAASLISAGRRI